jgi:hypothetical protein
MAAKRKIVSIVSAGEGWTATFSEGGAPRIYPVACFALTELSNGSQAIVPYVAIDREIVAPDDSDERHFIGLSRP